MGPEVGNKSAGRCSGYQKHHCDEAAVHGQLFNRVFRTLSRFSGFSDKNNYARGGLFESTGAGNHLTFITTGLFMSVILAFAMGIVFIGFRLLSVTIAKASEQAIIITTVTFLLQPCLLRRGKCRCCRCCGGCPGTRSSGLRRQNCITRH